MRRGHGGRARRGGDGAQTQGRRASNDDISEVYLRHGHLESIMSASELCRATGARPWRGRGVAVAMLLGDAPRPRLACTTYLWEGETTTIVGEGSLCTLRCDRREGRRRPQGCPGANVWAGPAVLWVPLLVVLLVQGSLHLLWRNAIK